MARARVLVAVIALATGGFGRDTQLPGPVRTEDPAPVGTGATLVVVAPDTLCAPDLELMVTHSIPDGGGRRYVFQAPVQPPECRWTVPDVPAGEYQAVLQKARGDQRVVAVSRLDVHPGSTWTTTIAPLPDTVEGLVSVQRIPVVGAYVEAKQHGDAGWSWEGRTDRDALGGTGGNRSVCAGDDPKRAKWHLSRVPGFRSRYKSSRFRSSAGPY